MLLARICLHSARVNSARVILQAIGPASDYNNNDSVDAADHVLWCQGGDLMDEDDTRGIVTTADFIAAITILQRRHRLLCRCDCGRNRADVLGAVDAVLRLAVVFGESRAA